jgi:Flp pilus assembly protein TadG
MTRLRHLIRDEKGVSVVELALFAPIMAIFAIGMIDLSMIFARQIVLEQAVHRAIEKAAVGTIQTDYNYLKADVAAAAGVPEANVTVTAWLECDRSRQPAFDGQCTDTQMVSRYVEVAVASRYRPTFSAGILGTKLFQTGSDGMVPLSAKTSLRVQ